jgi:hypothetical protein
MDLAELTTLMKDFQVYPQRISKDAIAAIFNARTKDVHSKKKATQMTFIELKDVLVRVALYMFADAKSLSELSDFALDAARVQALLCHMHNMVAKHPAASMFVAFRAVAQPAVAAAPFPTLPLPSPTAASRTQRVSSSPTPSFPSPRRPAAGPAASLPVVIGPARALLEKHLLSPGYMSNYASYAKQSLRPASAVAVAPITVAATAPRPSASPSTLDPRKVTSPDTGLFATSPTLHRPHPAPPPTVQRSPPPVLDWTGRARDVDHSHTSDSGGASDHSDSAAESMRQRLSALLAKSRSVNWFVSTKTTHTHTHTHTHTYTSSGSCLIIKHFSHRINFVWHCRP